MTVMMLMQWLFLILVDLLPYIFVHIYVYIYVIDYSYLLGTIVFICLPEPHCLTFLPTSLAVPSQSLLLVSPLLSDLLIVGCPRANCVCTPREPIIISQGILSDSCFVTVGSLRLSMVRVFIPWKLANTTNHGFPLTSC